MADDFDYGSPATDRQTFAAIAIVGAILALLFIVLDIGDLVSKSAQSLNDPHAPTVPVVSFRLLALAMGVWAVVKMFRVGAGNMVVLLHEERKLKLIHPIGIEKFVTFSSWTLLSNILYFSSVLLAAFYRMNEAPIPSLLEHFQIIMFAVACGTSFLTATVVRHIILPDFIDSQRDSQYMFQYHEQVMHNFAAIFMAIEVLLVVPTLRPEFALYCVGMGLIYVCFAYIYAYNGGGFYVYSFIDPRLRYAPFTMLALALAIAVFYLGIVLVTLVVEWNIFIGGVLMTAWVSLIVQFWSNDPNAQSSS
ncbi:MAG: hypothetical protein CMB19_01110 [Euryarchaeota archaeon]|nr:hypothetical protein [Euryarchaeota archaeon]